MDTPKDDALINAAAALYACLKEMSGMPAVKATLDKVGNLQIADGIGYSINERLALIAVLDVLRCYKALGYGTDYTRREANALLSFISMISDVDISAADVVGVEPFRTMFVEHIRNHDRAFSTDMPEGRYIIIDTLRAAGVESDVVNKYAVLFYRFASVMAKADATVDATEQACLENILTFTGQDKPEAPKEQEPSAEADPMASLKELIGLGPVKEEVARLANFIKVQQMRRDRGMKTTPMSCHCVFTGNPGTGKTTVARILAGIYRSLGVIAKGQLVETDRSGLVAEYVGQTAVKTNKIIDSALDGVLFIDEAYSLVRGSKEDYGSEAIATLLKRMEDDRDRLVVILAGYGDEMQELIDSNPGLQSRFRRYIHFPDYEPQELHDIFMLSAAKYDYVLTPDAEVRLRTTLERAIDHKDKNFGNGRFARNLLEQTMENQATRLAAVADIDDTALRTIEAVDIP